MISTEEAEKKMKSILNHLINLQEVAPVFSDKALSQFTDFLTESKVYQDVFIEFNSESGRLDDFYFKKYDINRYKELAADVKVLLTLSHGQASVEQGFCENTTVLAQNTRVESIVARHLIKDHLVSNRLQPQTIDITNEMMLRVKISHQRYKDHQISLAESAKAERNDVTKIILNQEIKDVQAKRDQLTKTSEILQNEFTLYVEETEKQQTLSLISKATAMKRKADEKREEVTKLEKTLGKLEQKRKLMK